MEFKLRFGILLVSKQKNGTIIIRLNKFPLRSCYILYYILSQKYLCLNLKLFRKINLRKATLVFCVSFPSPSKIVTFKAALRE